MLVEERVVEEVVRGIADPRAVVDDGSEVSWFAARQPGIVRHLALRCGEDSDAMAVALYYACAIEAAYARTRGHAPARVGTPDLQRAEDAFLSERPGRGGPVLADRQPALAQLVLDVVESPPVPLTEFEAHKVGLALAAVVYALDVAGPTRLRP